MAFKVKNFYEPKSNESKAPLEGANNSPLHNKYLDMVKNSAKIGFKSGLLDSLPGVSTVRSALGIKNAIQGNGTTSIGQDLTDMKDIVMRDDSNQSVKPDNTNTNNSGTKSYLQAYENADKSKYPTFESFEKAAQDYNMQQDGNLNPSTEGDTRGQEPEEITEEANNNSQSDVINTITGNAVNVVSRQQRRAGRRQDRLERKEIRKGGLTAGQTRRLAKNQEKAAPIEDSPMNANKPIGAVGLEEVEIQGSNKKTRVKHRLSKTRKKKNEATGAKKERLEKREKRLIKRRDKNTGKDKKIYSKKEGKVKREK